MRVAVIGSRSYVAFDYQCIIRALPDSCREIISGGARGVDTLAERIAREKGIPLRKFYPDYKTHGKRAPLVRNTEIVSQADFVLAFWDFTSRGTAHVIAECIRLRVPVRVYPIADWKFD